MASRKCTKVVRGQAAMDGAGVKLQRVLGLRTIHDFDPFLMLDGFDSIHPQDYIKGFPWHPHRGIETITYLLQGKIEHGDSLGNRGVIRDMECQWMTAGSGIIHQEMPVASPRMLGCQLWLNLPQKHKMTEPAYHDIQKADVPVLDEPGAVVKVLSGDYKGTRGPMQNKYINVTYLDVILDEGAEWKFSGVPNDHTLFLYVYEGSLAADEALENFEEKACAILLTSNNIESMEHDETTVKAGPNGAGFLLLAALPLKEPVAWGGPIVMNTPEELDLAFRELSNDTFIKHKRNTAGE